MAWRIESDPVRGRCVVAAEPVSLGGVIFTAEAFELVLYDDQLAQRCDCCTTQAEKLLR